MQIDTPEYQHLVAMQREAVVEFQAAQRKLATLDYAVRQAQLMHCGGEDVDDLED